MAEPRRPAGLAGNLWARIRDFAGAGDATYLWPRWIVLSAVGVVYLFVFGGILHEGQALVGPRGIAPLGELFERLHPTFPNLFEGFIRAPSVLWIVERPARMHRGELPPQTFSSSS